ncbi:MAG TPA: cytochrome c oxidase subunit 3 family protein [Polyangiaceae bacterium]|nr:cytochrome c oxidase subunit 3 family protein [Polyangiaceae bacterium]
MSEQTSEARSEARPVPGGAPNGPSGHVHADHGHGHGEFPHLAHHFDTPQQQFDAGKLGIWLFLLTEVLFFSGLFCAYTIYRAMRPEVFVYAHYFLDTNLGALNTCVLLVSSLTAAWAVRSAQLAQKQKLVANILITIVCAGTFMVVKYFEYSHKAHVGLLPGKNFQPTEQVWEVPSFQKKHPEAAEYARKLVAQAAASKAEGAAAPAAEASPAPEAEATKPTAEQIEPLIKAGVLGPKAEDPNVPSRPRNAHVFFGIYFFMTGLHGVHVLIGIGVWVWLLIRASKGVFGPMYFGPIDYAALYWHLVDLIWIYLFPLLYLIH